MTSERRSDERARLPLEMRWEGQSGKHVARVYDISLSGCYVETLGQVQLNEQIRFEIQLPTGRWMPLRGEVVHFQPDMGFGMRFTGLTETERELLARLIEYGRGG